MPPIPVGTIEDKGIFYYVLPSGNIILRSNYHTKAKLVQKHKGTLRFETRGEDKYQTGMLDIQVSDEVFNSAEEGKEYQLSVSDAVAEKPAEEEEAQ